MKDKKMAYIDQICREVKNILIDRTDYEISHILVQLDWYKGEKPRLSWQYYGNNEDTVKIEESEVESE